jgi:hypothetical protein
MQKTDVNTVLALIFLASAVMLIGGLAVIPAFEEAEATSKQNSILNRIPNLTVGGGDICVKVFFFDFCP